MKLHLQTEHVEINLATGTHAAEVTQFPTEKGETPILGSIRGTFQPANISRAVAMLPVINAVMDDDPPAAVTLADVLVEIPREELLSKLRDALALFGDVSTRDNSLHFILT